MNYEYFESNDEVRESLVRYMTNHHLIFQTFPSREEVDKLREFYIQTIFERKDYFPQISYGRESSLLLNS